MIGNLKKILSFMSIFKSKKKTNEFESVSGYAMGTSYTLIYPKELPINTLFLQRQIQKKLNSIENHFSLFREDSEINKINKCTLKKVKISRDMISLLQSVKKMLDVTQGAFMPIQFHDFTKINSKRKSKSASLISNIYSDFKIEMNSKSLIKSKDLRFDFNGIAKGYAVDKIADLLFSIQLNSFTFELGGEVFTTNYSHSIVMESSENKLFRVIPTGNCIATSGNLHSQKVINGERVNHIHNGHNGKPSEKKILSATVMGKHCVEAEALAKIPFTFPVKKSLAMIERYGYKAIIIEESGKINKSQGVNICQIDIS